VEGRGWQRQEQEGRSMQEKPAEAGRWMKPGPGRGMRAERLKQTVRGKQRQGRKGEVGRGKQGQDQTGSQAGARRQGLSVSGRQRQTGKKVQAGICRHASASRQSDSGAGRQVQAETGKQRQREAVSQI
jgi:hypothetical protein